jgi:hypothetical protein
MDILMDGMMHRLRYDCFPVSLLVPFPHKPYEENTNVIITGDKNFRKQEEKDGFGEFCTDMNDYSRGEIF